MMKCIRNLSLGCFLAGLIWSCGDLRGVQAGETATLDIATAADSVSVFRGQERNQSAQTLEENGKKLLKVSWDAGKFKYLELNLKQPLALPEFGSARAQVRVTLPAASTARTINLRLLDASGEVFQFRPLNKIDTGKVGEQICDYLLSGRTVEGCWAGNNNKVMDFPVKLLGVAFDYAPQPAAGYLLLGAITVEALPDSRQKAYYPLHHFDKMDLWTVNGAAKTTDDKPGLLVAASGPRVSLRELKWDLAPQERFRALRLKAELISGAATVQVGLRGENGVQAATAAAALTAGESTIVLPLDAALQAKLAGRMALTGLILSSPEKNAKVRLQELGVERWQEPLEAVTAEAETGSPLRVVVPGEEGKFSIRLVNHSTAAVQARIELTLRDLAGRALQSQTKVELQAGATQDWKPQTPPDRLGYWSAECRLYGAEGGSSQAPLIRTSSLAYMKPAGPTAGLAPGFLFSICSHTERWSRGEQEQEVLAAGLCGAKVLRVGQVWSQLQPEPERWRWDDLDRLVDQYAKGGMEVEYLLMFPPRWACPPEVRKSANWKDIMSCAPESEPWKNFIRTITARYKGKIRFWEVWNEPDLSGFAKFTSAEYVRMLKEAYETIKSVDPDAQVMTGGFATLTEHGGRREHDFQKNAITAGKGFFDIHAYHEHGDFPAYARLVDEQFLPMRAAAGVEKTRWYANETAVNSDWVGEAGQASTLFKKLLFAWSRGAMGYTWYDLRNDGFEPRNPEHNYGMLTNDFRPKPVYVAYNALAAEYGKAEYRTQLDGARGLWAFLFRRGDDLLLPAWREERGAAEARLIRTDAKSAEVIDLMGARETASLKDGYALLPFGTRPATLRLVGATRAEADGNLLAVGGQQYITPGKSSRLLVKVRNPLKEAAALRLSLTLPEGLVCAAATVQKELPAGAEVEIPFEFTNTPVFKTDFGKSLEVKLNYAIDAAGWKGTMSAPLNCAVVVPVRAGGSAEMDFRLEQRSQMVPLFANDPNSVSLLWTGPEDLSATVQLGADGQNMRLLVAVRDDRHSQPFTGTQIWMGDSVQFGVQKPGGTGFWEIGLAQNNTGAAEIFVWSAPAGASAEGLQKKLVPEIGQKDGRLWYAVTIPLKELGLEEKDLRTGIRFNLLVNDNDAGKRESWLEIAPHIGQDKNPAKFPLVIFAPATLANPGGN